jgi:hypothetical protein
VITAPFFLLICLVYARMHKGSDWLGILLGLGLGASLGAGPVRDTVMSLNEAAYAIGIEVINAIGARLGGAGGSAPAPTPANGFVVAARYNLGLVGIGR